MNKTNLVCSKCGTKVRKTNVKGYKYYCPECDEDLYSFETEKEKDSERIKFIKSTLNSFKWRKCDYCNEEFIEDDLKRDSDGKWICCGCNKEYEKIKDFNF